MCTERPSFARCRGQYDGLSFSSSCQEIALLIASTRSINLVYNPLNPDSCLRVGSLSEFIVGRQTSKPLYTIYRRDPPVSAGDYVQGIRGIHFPSTLHLIATWVYPALTPITRFMHCNSFVGMFLYHSGFTSLIPIRRLRPKECKKFIFPKRSIVGSSDEIYHAFTSSINLLMVLFFKMA